MQKPDPLFFSLQEMIVKLALIDRHHYLAGTEQHENDIEHSMAVTLLCWYIHDSQSIDLDISKILKYALAHDFVELHAGDTNTFASSEARIAKAQREQASLERMSRDFASFGDMVQIMQAYEDKADEEARFVWTVDKMQALIMGDLDGWRPYQKLGISYEQFVAKYAELLKDSSVHGKQIFDALIEYSKTTYYDQPR